MREIGIELVDLRRIVQPCLDPPGEQAQRRVQYSHLWQGEAAAGPQSDDRVISSRVVGAEIDDRTSRDLSVGAVAFLKTADAGHGHGNGRGCRGRPAGQHCGYRVQAEAGAMLSWEAWLPRGYFVRHVQPMGVTKWPMERRHPAGAHARTPELCR